MPKNGILIFEKQTAKPLWSRDIIEEDEVRKLGKDLIA